MYSVVLLLLLLHMSHNNYYIMPSHTHMCMCLPHGFDEHTCTSISALYYMHVTLIGLLQLPIMYLLLLMYSVLESQHMVAKLIIMAK